MTKEQENFILEHNGEYSFAHIAHELEITVKEIQDLLRSRKKFKKRIPYKNRSKEWKDEVAAYVSKHSITKTCDYFCIASSMVDKVIEEYNIQLMNRSDTLRVSREENFGSWDNYVQQMSDKARKTSIERYGVNNYATTKEAKQKSEQTCMEHFGVTNPMKSSDVVSKLNNTNLDRYGVVWPMQNKDILQKRINTSNDRYEGVGWASSYIKDKSDKTLLLNYGVTHNMKSDFCKKHVNETCLQKYGVLWPCLTDNCRTYQKDSGPNKRFAEYLDNLHLEYQREFTISRYAYDFKVNNILVEIDPSPTHNATWGVFSDKPIDKMYHKIKSTFAYEHGYRCIHVWDWDDANRIIELILPRESLYARNCCIQSVDKQVEKEFLNTHHLQGYVKSTVCYGLFFDNNLISLMSFGTPRYNKKYEWELLRYCSVRNVIGGAKKLFSHFTRNYNTKSIISYCDLSKFTGDVYSKLGFISCGDPQPSKHWYNIKTGKHITDNLLRQRGFDQLLGKEYGYFGKNSSNEQLMLQHGFVEIYDCGQATYIWTQN